MVKWFMVLVFLYGGLAMAQDSTAQEPISQQAPTQAEEEIPEIEVKSIQSYLAPFSYDASNLRNPFIHPELAIPLKPGEVYGPFLPLQLFTLNQLKVNGLFWNTSKPKAIISTPGGQTYDVGLKDYIGENFGYVASIREKELVVIQTLEEGGQRYTTTKIMFLTNNTRSEQ